MVDDHLPVKRTLGRSFFDMALFLVIDIVGREAVLGCGADTLHDIFSRISHCIAAASLLEFATCEVMVAMWVDTCPTEAHGACVLGINTNTELGLEGTVEFFVGKAIFWVSATHRNKG